MQHLDVQALFQSSVRVYGRKSLAETWRPSSKGYILHRGMLHRKNFSIMTDWGVRIIQHRSEFQMWKGFHGKYPPLRGKNWLKKILWAKDQGFDLRLNDMASDDLLSESSEAPREGIEQEFQAACVANSGEGVLKKADTFQIHTRILKSLQSESIAGQGVRVGRGPSSSRPLPSPPRHYNTLLHIIRRHIIIHHDVHRSEGYDGRYHS